MIVSNAGAIAGFLLLTILPGMVKDPFTGILIAVFVCAIGGGLQEVLVSPIVEACPTKNRESTMSLLHGKLNPVITLLGCGLAGFSVGIFWPGTFSLASAGIKGGSTLKFALLALAGDLGCSGGPALAGAVMSASGGNMRIGIGAAIVFPLLMGAGMILSGRAKADR